MEKKCNNCRFELYNPDEIPCKDCGMDNREYWMPKTQTNADRIRAMSDEELANVLTDFSNNGGWITETGREICYKRHIEWLKQPAEE